jgi:quinol monooxygenase YgiN
MTAYNVVRMRVKPGREEEFLNRNRDLDRKSLEGFRKLAIIKTGDRSYCVIGEWESMDALAAARLKMIGMLDKFRDLLEDLGGSLGVTDPVSGEAVVELS